MSAYNINTLLYLLKSISMLKILLDHTTLPQNDLRIRAESIFKKMNNQSDYATFQDLTTVLGGMIPPYIAALFDMEEGGKSVTKNKNKLKDELTLFLTKLAKKIETTANDLSIEAGQTFILGTGFTIQKTNTKKSVDYLEVPTNFTVVNDPQKKGNLLLKWNRATGALMYLVEELDEAGNWQNAGFSNLTSLVVTGYEPDSKKTFRLKAIGSNGRMSDYTDPLSIRVRL
jgi:hypothetical protein